MIGRPRSINRALSLLKIISGRSDDAIRTELAWRRSFRIVGQRVVAARPWPIPGAYGFRCSRAHIMSGRGANPFAEDQNMIQALAAKRPDQAFHIWVLPGRPGCDRAVANPHPSHAVGEGLPVSTIIVADQIARCRIPWECFPDLLS